ncbi:MAG: RagB/SusD family nutrient uptake outer membrane protein [Bacteroidales bacterium]
MKKIYLIIVAATLSLTSCNKWLDIQPELELRKNAIFENEQGFKDVLIGSYIRMATPSLYGLNTTMVLPELVSQHWTPVSGTLSAYLSSFDYTQTTCKNLFESVWLQYYQTILNINSILEEIDAKKDMFTNGNYDLIRGEALGLRAFLHFEILRFWGGVPGSMILTDKAIPYVKNVTKDPNKLIANTYQEVLDNILADLNSAEQLLATDPILTYSNAVLNSPATMAGIDKTKPYPADEYHFFRQVRFNFYAVKATKARYYLWKGEAANALENAQVVINAKNSDGTAKFILGNETAANNGQLTFPTEHIFAVSNTLSTQTLTSVFFNNNTAYTQNATYLNTAYETTLHASDIRYRNNRLWEVRVIPLAGNFNFFKKYNDTDSKTAVKDIPLIRLSEMYFIAAECGGETLFRDYRIARVLDPSIDGTLTSPTAIKDRLEKEYRKEFYGEGQMFFFYKRLNYNKFTWPVVKNITEAVYRLPLPESQSMFE